MATDKFDWMRLTGAVLLFVSSISLVLSLGSYFGLISFSFGAPPRAQSGFTVEEAFADRAEAAGYDSMDPKTQAVWRTAATTLYHELKAYELNFEITEDPQKNCAEAKFGSPGGCFHLAGDHEDMIYLSSDLRPAQTRWVMIHEYSHYEQKYMGNRYSDDLECDADLRSYARMGVWGSGYKDVCAADGYPDSELNYELLPKIAADYLASRSE